MVTRREISIEQLCALADGEYVFAVVDACGVSNLVTAKAQEAGEERAVCLLTGTYLKDHYAVAPYLFNVDRQFTHWISSSLEKARWGVFVLAKERRDVLIRHLQRFFFVGLPDGRKVYFRYYDPPILQAYLATCQPEELHLFFGPVRGFAVPGAEEHRLWLFEPPVLPSQHLTQPPKYPIGLWTIRKEQFEALGNVSKEHFVKQVTAHVQQFFPERYELLGEVQVLQMIRFGIQKAAAYGITAEADVCRYIDLLFVFGAQFDRDPQYEWAREILNDSSCSAAARMLRVREKVARLAGQDGPSHGG